MKYIDQKKFQRTEEKRIEKNRKKRSRRVNLTLESQREERSG